LNNSHLAAILESPFVTEAFGLTLRAPSRSNSASRIERRSAATPPQGLSSGCDDLTIFEQPEFFCSLLEAPKQKRHRNIDAHASHFA